MLTLTMWEAMVTGLPTWITLAFTLPPAVVPFHLTTPGHQIGWYIHIICMLEKLFTIPKEFYARQRIEPQVAMAEQKVWYIATLLCLVCSHIKILIAQYQLDII